MYCAAFSFKDVFDTTDMRSTAGADASYAMDAPPEDSTIVAELRAKGAIIYAKANLAEYNAGGGNPGGAKAGTRTFGAGARSSWAGTSCNVYDTAREPGGSSSGSLIRPSRPCAPKAPAATETNPLAAANASQNLNPLSRSMGRPGVAPEPRQYITLSGFASHSRNAAAASSGRSRAMGIARSSMASGISR